MYKDRSFSIPEVEIVVYTLKGLDNSEMWAWEILSILFLYAVASKFRPNIV